MKLQAGSFCPLIKKDCIELKCAWFTQLRGHNPNTGEEIDDWGCAVGWLPVLLVENSQQQRSTGAAVDSFRNEMFKANESSHKVLTEATKLRLVKDDEDV